jgi:hypothetical protein
LVRLRGSFAVDLPSSPCSRLRGVNERVSLSPESERRRFRRLTTWKMRYMAAKVVSPSVVLGGGVLAPRSVDSLSAMGGLPVQAFGGDAAGFAGVTSCAMKTMPGLRMVFLVFSLFSGLFCKNLGWM